MAHSAGPTGVTGTERLVRLAFGPVLLAAAVAALSGYAPLATGVLNVLFGIAVLVFGAVLLVTGATTSPRPPIPPSPPPV